VEILQKVKGPLNEFVAKEGSCRVIQREIRHFLT
jgi:hypothetical protein